MVFKKQVYFLSGLVALLALANILTVVFEPDRLFSRSAAYSWFDPRFKDQVNRISISRSSGILELERKNNKWSVLEDGAEYPARQILIEDLLKILSDKAAYPVRASAVSSHEQLGVSGENAESRIVLYGAAGQPLLDLLIGNIDVSGRGVYLRNAGENEVRLGNNEQFMGYAARARSSWYNLRLIPESETMGSTDVRRITIYPSAGSGDLSDKKASWDFTRDQNTWTISGLSVTNPDKIKIENYVRNILDIEGVDFVKNAESLSFDDSRVVIELGNGTAYTISMGPPDSTSRRNASVSGAPHIYAIAGWMADRIFRDAEFFERR
jgi:hypothetical protein